MSRGERGEEGKKKLDLDLDLDDLVSLALSTRALSLLLSAAFSRLSISSPPFNAKTGALSLTPAPGQRRTTRTEWELTGPLQLKKKRKEKKGAAAVTKRGRALFLPFSTLSLDLSRGSGLEPHEKVRRGQLSFSLSLLSLFVLLISVVFLSRKTLSWRSRKTGRRDRSTRLSLIRTLEPKSRTERARTGQNWRGSKRIFSLQPAPRLGCGEKKRSNFIAPFP